MQYVDGTGITATGKEFAALVEFCGESERLSSVSIRVRDGKLVAWATDGANAAYLHGKAWNGEGKPSEIDRDWQLSLDMARSLKKAMGTGDEAILKTNPALRLYEAEIREIEGGKVRMKVDLDGHISEQLDLSLPGYFPSRPIKDAGEVPAPRLLLSWNALHMLKKVCEAAHSDVVSMYIGSNPALPTYVEVGKPADMDDEENVPWVCILSASSAVRDEQGDNASKAIADFRQTCIDNGVTVTVNAEVVEKKGGKRK